VAIKTKYWKSLESYSTTDYLKNYKIKITSTLNSDSFWTPGTLPGKIRKIAVGAFEDHGQEGHKNLVKQRLQVYARAGFFASTNFFKDEIDTMFHFQTRTINYNATIKIPDNERTDYSDENLFLSSHAFYNFPIKTYETLSGQINELFLPCFLNGLRVKDDPLNVVAIEKYRAPVNNYDGNPAELNMVTKIDGVNKNYYMFDNRPRHNADRPEGWREKNYFYNFAKRPPDLDMDAFKSNKSYLVTSKWPAGWSQHVRDVPFFNKINLDNVPERSSRRKLKEMLNHYGAREMFLSIVKNNSYNSFQVANEAIPSPTEDTFDLSQPEGSNVIEEYRQFDFIKSIYGFDRTKIAKKTETFIFPRSNDSIYDSYGDADELSVVATQESIGAELRAFMLDISPSFEKNVIRDKPETYVEFMCWKVVKYRSGLNTPVQTYYFYNHNSAQVFIDTQIRFNATYEYRTFGVYFMAMHEAHFEFVGMTGTALVPIAEIDYIVKPQYKIVEIPFHSKSLLVVEPPPPQPTIKFSDVGGIDHKIRISMRSTQQINIARTDRKPLITFRDSGNEYAERLSLYCYTNKHYYSHIASDSVFEIFRLEEEPSNIYDFRGNMIYTVGSSRVDTNGDRHCMHSTFDYLEHQKKYYYLFRTLTHNNNPGQFSSVYCVEKYKDADETMIRVNRYVPKDKKKFYEANFRRFMRVQVNSNQFVFNEDSYVTDASAEDNIPYFKLGETGIDSIWKYKGDSHIKLRLESVNTGRKLDINFFFRYNVPITK